MARLARHELNKPFAVTVPAGPLGIVFVSTAVLRDSTLTLLEGIGFCIALTGFVLYQHARRNPTHSFADIWRDLATFCGGR